MGAFNNAFVLFRLWVQLPARQGPGAVRLWCSADEREGRRPFASLGLPHCGPSPLAHRQHPLRAEQVLCWTAVQGL